ncbi:adenylate/guanylate cyclase domain-containing protein [Bdellovibrio sp. HCB2-146]|uniref:adenylate/guanylate cyclase domain-containing protein n=1 Tax=Bdellovibrio sp. HCB2-146 TaxID=3394362 RepID=UPI0039BD6A92
MKFLEKLFFTMFPRLLLTGTPWVALWDEQERKAFLNAARIIFPIMMLVYILHYFTVDRSEGLAPSELWFNYRFGMAAICGVTALFYCVPKLSANRLYKVPLILACAVCTYFQARTVVWYPKVPYLYVYAFIFFSAVMLRSSIMRSVLLAAAFSALTWSTLVEAGQSPAMIASASVVTMVFVIIARSKYVSDINLFIANQRNFDQQKKFIEVNLEFTNQIKAFLPAEISKRLMYFIQESRMSTLQAIDEVLRPRTLPVACLYSDIRGFTRDSNDLSGYVSQAMLPNVKISTELVEKHNGIPRKIGDLIFAYYDSPEIQFNILNAMLSAASISRFNSQMNENLPEGQRIKRYILVSCGDAIVGNLSSYESAIEITAIGSPVNILSRIDELTKQSPLKEQLEQGDVIITSRFAELLGAIRPQIDLKKINLRSLNLKIRDFDDVESIYVFKTTKNNLEALMDESRSSIRYAGVA